MRCFRLKTLLYFEFGQNVSDIFISHTVNVLITWSLIVSLCKMKFFLFLDFCVKDLIFSRMLSQLYYTLLVIKEREAFDNHYNVFVVYLSCPKYGYNWWQHGFFSNSFKFFLIKIMFYNWMKGSTFHIMNMYREIAIC